MQRRILGTELLVILFALLFVEIGEVIRELQADVVYDWFVSLAPLIWVDMSVLVLYAFIRLLRSPDLAGSSPGSAAPSARTFLVPDFRAIPSHDPRLRRTWIVAAVAYGLTYAFLQGILVVDPSGSLDPLFAIIDSPIGYGPALVWAPSNTLGIVLRPYSIAAAIALSVLSGLVIALSLRVVASSRRAAGALSSPLVGFAVMCPACVGAPVSGLFLAYAAPLSAMGMLGAASAFSRMLLISTVLLVGALFLLWIVVSLFTNVLLSRKSAPADVADRRGSV